MNWLFFDLGSTLLDETDVLEKCVRGSLEQSAVPYDEFIEKMNAFAFRNKSAYKCAIEYYGLSKTRWDPKLEKLYPGVTELLERLSGRFSLGIIANQMPGLSERLSSFGIDKYFKVKVDSSSFGKTKPDKEIFLAALEKAGCKPKNAVMVGDRLDNDIIPAQKLGMKTVWVKQGLGGLGNPSLLEKAPDYIIDKITDIEKIL